MITFVKTFDCACGFVLFFFFFFVFFLRERIDNCNWEKMYEIGNCQSDKIGRLHFNGNRRWDTRSIYNVNVLGFNELRFQEWKEKNTHIFLIFGTSFHPHEFPMSVLKHVHVLKPEVIENKNFFEFPPKEFFFPTTIHNSTHRVAGDHSMRMGTKEQKLEVTVIVGNRQSINDSLFSFLRNDI